MFSSECKVKRSRRTRRFFCARSEVFRKQLSAGMQESVSGVISIEDCDVGTFKAFLRFIYTDLLPSTVEPGAKTEDDAGGALQMLALLAVSHKYQATRLQLWCEAQLCNQLSTSEVCDILCQAHVFEAKQLEKACYAYIKDHMAEVLKLPAYAELVTKWPRHRNEGQPFHGGCSGDRRRGDSSGF